MTIKLFNQQLNASSATEGQYQHWQTYREAVTAFIISNTLKGGTTTIIGAGNCNDVDLSALQKHHHRLVLTDIDMDAMERGCHQQKVEVERVAVDYLGLEKTDLLEKAADLLIHFNLEMFKKHLHEMLEVIKEQDWQWLGDIEGDVVVLPIYTQLLFRQIESSLNGGLITDLISQENYTDAVRVLLDVMPRVIKAFNHGIEKTLDAGRNVIVLSDYLEDVPDGQYAGQFLDLAFESVYTDYYNQYGMGLGHYGHYDMNQRLKPMAEQWLRWPFDGHRHMFVKAISYINA